jgi:hypothetical protein
LQKKTIASFTFLPGHAVRAREPQCDPIHYPQSRFKPAKVLSKRLATTERKAVFFSSKLTVAEGEGPVDRSNLGGGRSVVGLHASLIFVIALPEAKDNTDPG